MFMATNSNYFKFGSSLTISTKYFTEEYLDAK